MPMHAEQPSILPRPPEPDECEVVLHACEVNAVDEGGAPTIVVAVANGHGDLGKGIFSLEGSLKAQT